jgi:hypothetical protein
MLHRIDAPRPSDPSLAQWLDCGACGRDVWLRGWPFPMFNPCAHILLFTDCEAEVESWCEAGLLAFAREALGDELEGSDDELREREGPLYHAAFDLLERLPRPDDPPLFACVTEGEYGDGVVLSTAPLVMAGDEE